MSLVFLVFLAVTSESLEVGQSAAATPPAKIVMSAQLGGGMLSDTPALVLKPRLGLVSPHATAIMAPSFWVTLYQPAPTAANAKQRRYDPRFESRFDAPETYTGFIELLRLSTPGEAATLTLAPLQQITLGHGSLVEGFAGQSDSQRPRTGAQAVLRLPHLAVTVLGDSLIAPNLLATDLQLAPLAWAGLDSDARLQVRMQAAVDPRAPAADGRAPAGGGLLDVAYAPYRGTVFGCELYASGVALYQQGQGLHAGLQLEWQSGRPERDALVVRLEGVAAGNGYRAGYFDDAYVVERQARPAVGLAAKQEIELPGALGARGSIEAKVEGVRLGVRAGRLGADRPLLGSAYMGVSNEAVSLTASLSKRALWHAEGLLHRDPETFALIDAAVSLGDGLYLFGLMRRSVRQSTDRPLVTDWSAGLGYGLALL